MSYLSLLLLNLVPVVGVLFFQWPVQGVYWFFVMEFLLSLIFNSFKLRLYNRIAYNKTAYGNFLFSAVLGAFIPGAFIFILGFGDEFWYMSPFWFPRIDNHLPEIALLLVSFSIDFYYFKKENIRKHDMSFLVVMNPLYSLTFVFVLLISIYLVPYKDVDVMYDLNATKEAVVITRGGAEVWGPVIGLLFYLTGRAVLKRKNNCYF